jgi:hypothetical protein
MWEAPPEIQHQQVDGYTHYNYAVLHGTGVAHIFDFLRYNHCFLARRSDLEMLLEVTRDEEYGKWVTRQYAILLCRYDWTGKTKANWAYDILMSDQKLDECSDLQTLFELGSDMETLRAKPKLKWKHTLEVTGPLAWVLGVMYENKAIPATEADANRIEQAFYAPDEVTVFLANFLAVQAQWTLPPKEAIG